jgi:cephalosporin hydroxylase
MIGRLTVRPIQVKEEIAQLLGILQRMRPRTLVEIGTANGGTLFLLTRVSSSCAVIVSVDLPSGKFGGGYLPSLVQVYRSFATAKQNVVPMRADSHDPVTLTNVKRLLDEDPIDFLMIDGDHSYEGVRSDFELYSPMVRRGGIIAFHDIVPGLPSHVGGVPKFWREIRSKYAFREVVKNWGQGGSGIGILFA